MGSASLPIRSWTWARGLSVALVVWFSSAAHADPNARESVFTAFAEELVGQITDGNPSSLDKFFSYVRVRRIAVWPFREDQIPVSAAVAEELNAALEAALIRQSRGKFQFKARKELKPLIADMKDTGVLDDVDGAPIAALLKKAQEIDFLVIGSMRLDARALSLSYSAVGRDGRVYGRSGPKRIVLSAGEIAGGSTALTPDQAIKAAAKHLAELVPDLTELRLGGIRFQDSGAQPPFALYLEEKMAAALQEVAVGLLSNRRIAVKRAEITNAQIARSRGMDVPHRDLRPKFADATAGAYMLTGTYWDFGDNLETRIALEDAAGKSVSWVGRISVDALGGLVFWPKTDLKALRETDGLGPISFQLSTPRGPDPAYRIGEKLDLLIRLGRDAWVYCFYRQENGETTQIFPNPHFWLKFREPKLPGGKLHTIPGPDIFPFEFVLREPAGLELVKCFAVSRDVTRELPNEFRGTTLSSLPQGSDMRLSSVFRRLPDVTLSEASVAVTVAR